MARLIDADALIDALMAYTWRDEDERLIDDADEKREFIKNWMPDLPTFATDINVPNKWISVKDRLPKENTAVNVVWVNHNPKSYYAHIKDKPFVATGVYYDGDWYWWSDVIEDVISEYGGRVNIAGMIDPDIKVTHWMPLPEPPKESEVG